MTLGTNDVRCPLCGDVYNMMEDEGHLCRMTQAERGLLDAVAGYFGSAMSLYSGVNREQRDAALAYLKEREPHKSEEKP